MTTTTAQKQPYETALEEFQEADEEYSVLMNYIDGGKFIADIFQYAKDPERATMEWVNIWGKLKEALDLRNRKLREVKDALRLAINTGLGSSVQGPDARPFTITLNDGKIVASSTTGRTFNGPLLLQLCQQYGLDKELRELQATDDKGLTEPAVRTVLEISYGPVLNWLQTRRVGAINSGQAQVAQMFEDILNRTYVETRKTPSVKGIKELSFMGEVKDAK